MSVKSSLISLDVKKYVSNANANAKPKCFLLTLIFGASSYGRKIIIIIVQSLLPQHCTG